MTICPTCTRRPKPTKEKPSYKPIYPVEPIPCLAEEAILALRELVTGKEVLELGSGGSTLWLAQRASKVTSIENDPDWFAVVKSKLVELGLDAEVKLVKTEDIHNSVKGQWDVIFVDPLKQIERKLSIIAAIDHVRPGGYIVADDYNFPMVAEGVNVLRNAGWEVHTMAGKKLHPVRRVQVNTSIAFCRKPMP